MTVQKMKRVGGILVLALGLCAGIFVAWALDASPPEPVAYATAKRRQNVFGSFFRRNNEGDETCDCSSLFIREEEHSILNTLDLVQFLAQIV